MKNRYVFWIFFALLAGLASYYKLIEIARPIPLRNFMTMSLFFFFMAMVISAYAHKNNHAFDYGECDDYYFWIIAILSMMSRDITLTHITLAVAAGASTTGTFISWYRKKVRAKKVPK